MGDADRRARLLRIAKNLGLVDVPADPEAKIAGNSPIANSARQAIASGRKA
jgi:hypothetical protein